MKKKRHFVPVGNTNRDKRVRQPRGRWLPLLSRLVLPTGTKGLFFHVFLFSILFLFQLYFCISIKLMYWNSVCMISTNIYIYIYSSHAYSTPLGGMNRDIVCISFDRMSLSY